MRKSSRKWCDPLALVSFGCARPGFKTRTVDFLRIFRNLRLDSSPDPRSTIDPLWVFFPLVLGNEPSSGAPPVLQPVEGEFSPRPFFAGFFNPGFEAGSGAQRPI